MLFPSVRDVLNSFRSSKRARRKKQKPHATRLSIERLEDRTVPSVTSVFELDGNATPGVLGPPAPASTTISHDWNQVFSDSSSCTANCTTNAAGTNAIFFATDPVNST